MPKRPKAYVAALPLSDLPEFQELLSRCCGAEDRRGNVVMVRLGDEAVKRLDELIESGIFGSRSEAAAFLVGAGIEAQKELFAGISKSSAEIRELRQKLRQEALRALRSAAPAQGRARASKRRT